MPGILARYVTVRFLMALALFAIGLTAFFAIADLVLRMDKFLEAGKGSVLTFVYRYYANKIPFFIILTVPASILLAAVFTVTRLSQANELVPMMVGGVSLRRLSAPFMAVAVLSVPFLAWLHFEVLPTSWQKFAVLEDQVRSSAQAHNLVQPDGEGNHLSGRTYYSDRKILKGNVRLIASEQGRPVLEIECERAEVVEWDPKEFTARWKFQDGSVYPLEDGRRVTEPVPGGGFRLSVQPLPREGRIIELKITPVDLTRRNTIGRQMTLPEALRHTRRYPQIPLYQMQVFEKFTAPLAPLLLLLIGLPLALNVSGRRGANAGLGLALMIVIVFFTTQLMFQHLGNHGLLPALGATVAPTGGLLGLGALLFVRLRT